MTSRVHAFNRGTVMACTILILVVSITGVAMSNSVLGTSDNSSFVGTRDTGSAIAQAAPIKSSQGTATPWGVFAYESDRGLTCVQAGIVKGGNVGAFNGKEFRPFSPRESIGNCGDLASGLKTEGGLAFAAEAPVSDDVSDRSGVVYGLLNDVSRVTVTVDETSKSVPVQIDRVTDVDGAASAFIAPLPSGVKLPGVTITFERNDGSRTVSTI